MRIPASVRDSVAAEGLDRPSAWRTNIHLIGALGAYLAIYAAADSLAMPVVWPLAWIAMAFLLFGAAAVMHEAVHGNLYRSRLANRVTGILAAGAILVCWSMYRAFHLQHHAATRTERDPERQPQAFAARRDYLMLLLGGPLFVFRLGRYVVRTVRGRPPSFVHTATLRRGIKVDAAVLALIYAALLPVIALYPLTVVKLWLVPLVIAYVYVFPLVLLPEHFGGKGDVSVYENTRTVRSNGAFRWAFWNNNLHTAHHVVPVVPFHRLPRLHKLIAPDVAWVEPSYIGFHWKVLRAIGSDDAKASPPDSLPPKEAKDLVAPRSG